MGFFKASFVLLAITLTALAGPLGKRDLPTIQQDVADFKTALDAVTADLSNLGDAGAPEFVAVAQDTATMIANIKKATDEINNTGPLNEEDSNTLFTQSVTPAATDLLELLELFTSEHPEFEQLSPDVPGLIKTTQQNLMEFAEAVLDFTDALSNNNPPDVVSQEASLSSSIVGAFETALITFSD